MHAPCCHALALLAQASPAVERSAFVEAWIPSIPPEIPAPVYFLLVGLGVLVIGISKAGFGGGVGILAVPLMAIAIVDPERTLGIMLPTLILADVLSNLHYLKDYDARPLKPMLLGAGVGVLLSSLLLWALVVNADASVKPIADRVLKGLIGVICLGFVGLQAWTFTGHRAWSLPRHPMSAGVTGFVAGFVSTFSHAAGPIAMLYLLQEKLEKRTLVACLLLFFLAVNLAKTPAYLALGMINPTTLLDSLWFLPLIPVGTLLGAWMHKRIPARPFIATMYVAAGVTSVVMIYQAVFRMA
jgi:hypothetical protein